MTQPTNKIEALLPTKGARTATPNFFRIHVGQGEPVAIRFQDGPIDDELGTNGALMEDMIDVLVLRLEHFQKNRATACMNNEVALQMLRAAKFELLERTNKRNAAGVTGTQGQHE